jgi:hypothetical protein
MHTDRRAGPDVRTVEERVPRLDPLRARAKRSGDALTGVGGLARVRLRARLRVVGRQRRDADGERCAIPDVRAGHEVVQLLHLARGERELGLDGRTGREGAVRDGDAGSRVKRRTMSHRRSWCRSVLCILG